MSKKVLKLDITKVKLPDFDNKAAKDKKLKDWKNTEVTIEELGLSWNHSVIECQCRLKYLLAEI